LRRGCNCGGKVKPERRKKPTTAPSSTTINSDPSPFEPAFAPVWEAVKEKIDEGFTPEEIAEALRKARREHNSPHATEILFRLGLTSYRGQQ
jgi:hypothetical protein